DIIREVPFVHLPTVFNVKVEGVQGQKRLDRQEQATFDQVKEFNQGKQLTAAAVPFLLTPAMVVTHGCDLDNAFTGRYAQRWGFWHMGRTTTSPGDWSRSHVPCTVPSLSWRRRRPHPRSSCPHREKGRMHFTFPSSEKNLDHFSLA